jgi:hypothetical protein
MVGAELGGAKPTESKRSEASHANGARGEAARERACRGIRRGEAPR